MRMKRKETQLLVENWRRLLSESSLHESVYPFSISIDDDFVKEVNNFSELCINLAGSAAAIINLLEELSPGFADGEEEKEEEEKLLSSFKVTGLDSDKSMKIKEAFNAVYGELKINSEFAGRAGELSSGSENDILKAGGKELIALVSKSCTEAMGFAPGL